MHFLLTIKLATFRINDAHHWTWITTDSKKDFIYVAVVPVVPPVKPPEGACGAKSCGMDT
jgi:hypothetical protein